jgi:hypothetical protein
VLDISTETLIAPNDIAKRIPGRGGRPTNFATIWRWIMKGATAPDGTRVRLRAARIGAKWVTSVEAVQEFLQALTPRFEDKPLQLARSASKRQAASGRARKRLVKAGVYQAR